MAHSRATAAAAPLLLAWLLLLSCPPAVLAQFLDILPGQCSTLTFDFNSDDPSYVAYITIPDNGTEGCVLRISRLYIQGTCTSLRNNEGTGCGSSSGTVANASAASCADVFVQAPAGAIVTPPMPANRYVFDSGAICNAYSDVALFYVNYSCTAAPDGQPQLPLPLEYDAELRYNRYAGCGASSTSWTRYVIGVVVVAVALFLFGFIFYQCIRRRRSGAAAQQPGAVQLAPHSPPPMTTVTLGHAPADDDEGRLLAAAAPAPLPGGGNPFAVGGAAAAGAPGSGDAQSKV